MLRHSCHMLPLNWCWYVSQKERRCDTHILLPVVKSQNRKAVCKCNGCDPVEQSDVPRDLWRCRLVGVSDLCHRPPEAADCTVVTKSKVDCSHLTPEQVEAHMQAFKDQVPSHLSTPFQSFATCSVNVFCCGPLALRLQNLDPASALSN